MTVWLITEILGDWHVFDGFVEFPAEGVSTRRCLARRTSHPSSNLAGAAVDFFSQVSLA